MTTPLPSLARLLLLVLLVGSVAGCREQQVPPTGPTTTVVTTVVSGPGSGPTTPTPTGPTTTNPSGSYLPLPTYGQSVLTSWASSPQGQSALASSCYLQVGAANSWMFIDGLVDRLRALDGRWGYVCYRGSCSQPSQDAVAYYAATGLPVNGATGIWTVNVIASYCTGSAQPTWGPTYDATGQWTTRGRF